MRIHSTFRDYYDIWADGTGPVLQRVGGNSGPTKREQFRILEEAGWLTPPNGVVGEILDSWWEAERQRVKWVVAYTDETAHCTEGKEVWWKQCASLNRQPKMGYDAQNERANRNYREVYCSAFVGSYPQFVAGNQKSTSLRYLQVGPHVFWIEYSSTESWMSNYGDGDIQVVCIELDKGYHPKIRLPLFAVDFVLGREMYAVDFNTAPGIRGSGVEKVLSGKDCCQALERALEDLR